MGPTTGVPEPGPGDALACCERPGLGKEPAVGEKLAPPMPGAELVPLTGTVLGEGLMIGLELGVELEPCAVGSGKEAGGLLLATSDPVFGAGDPGGTIDSLGGGGT